MVYGIYQRCYEAAPSNPKGIPYTTASEESMWLVPQLTAFRQSQAGKSIPLGNTFGFRQLREQRLEKCGLCPITLHFSRPLIGGRQATVVQLRIGQSVCKSLVVLRAVANCFTTVYYHWAQVLNMFKAWLQSPAIKLLLKTLLNFGITIYLEVNWIANKSQEFELRPK